MPLRKELMLMLLTSLDTQSKPLHAAYSSPNSNLQRNKSLPFHRSIIPEKQLTILLLSLPKKITLNYIYWRNSLWKTSFFAWYLISITGITKTLLLAPFVAKLVVLN